MRVVEPASPRAPMKSPTGDRRAAGVRSGRSSIKRERSSSYWHRSRTTRELDPFLLLDWLS
jgi:hypothetical protein